MTAPIRDFASLLAAVTDYLDRPEEAASVPGFVALAESRFNTLLRAREMEQAVVAPTRAASLALPTDFIEWIAVEWADADRLARPTFAESNSPEARFRHRPGGDPQYFTILAGQVRMVPAKPGAITLFYYQALPGLSEAAPSNWLLAKAPDAYLYATLGEAFLYQKDPEAAQTHLQLAIQALSGIELKADTQKVAKRVSRVSEIEASAQAVKRPE